MTERVGKSPTELMTGEKHLHWLEMLGFDREGCRLTVGISNRGVELFNVPENLGFYDNTFVLKAKL